MFAIRRRHNPQDLKTVKNNIEIIYVYLYAQASKLKTHTYQHLVYLPTHQSQTSNDNSLNLLIITLPNCVVDFIKHIILQLSADFALGDCQ